MTMIQINNAILHVFDQHSGVTVYSKEGLDCTQKDVAEYLTKHIDIYDKQQNHLKVETVLCAHFFITVFALRMGDTAYFV